MAEPSDTDWRYGVALFPLPPILSLAALGSSRAFISLTTTDSLSDADALAGVATFVLGILASWLAVLFALVVVVSVFMDARALADRGWWSPNRYVFGAVGLVHLVGTQFLPLSLLSTTLLLYYAFQRRQHVP